MFMYLVDWGNGFVGGFDKKFNQMFNGDKRDIFHDLKSHHVTEIKIISHAELDELRGYHKPTFEEYLGALS